MLEGGSWIGLSDPERHVLITLGWKQAGGLASALLTGRDLARNTEKNIRRSMKVFGYRADGFAERPVAGGAAHGFRYGYRAQDAEMYGESFILKSGKTIYYFHLYARAALKAASLPPWEALLDSARRA